MEIASSPISSCSKEHQLIYQEWFNYADSGTFFACIHKFLYISMFVHSKIEEISNRKEESLDFDLRLVFLQTLMVALREMML